MKILIIENNVNDFFSSRFKFAIFLKNKGHDVFVLLPNYKFCKEDGLNFLSYNFRRNKISFYNYIIQVLFYRKLFKMHNFDIIHSFRFAPNIISSLSNLFLRSHLITHITGLGVVYSNKALKFVFYRTVSNYFYLLINILSDVMVFQNFDDIISLKSFIWFKDKTHIILGSGVDTDFYINDELKRTELKVRYGLPEKSILFTCTTRIIKEKGIFELIDAFNDKFLINKDVYLFIVGGPDVENPNHIKLDDLITRNKNSKIKILGKRKDILEILNCTDVFIYPSYYREGIPRSILEALSMGIPILTSNMPGCNLTVEYGKNGYLFDEVSVVEIVTKVQLMINNKSLIDVFGEFSRQLAINKFSNEIIYSRMYELYLMKK
ncbi:glycosyltransferase [Aquirufa lenticrescens]